MAGRIDDIKQRYEAFASGDVDSALDNWADDFVWQGSN
jgi:ketosteroid isomerase-like protein